MSSIAFWSTKWTLDIATKLIKANVRLHNYGALRDDMSIIYVVNHFTRLETILLPYVLYKHTDREIWSLAADELFHGRIGSYLRSMGTVSTRDPDRDKIIVRVLLSGEHPWIIFPEGSMIKDKKVIDHRREFSVYSEGERRPPRTGAASLALRSEYYRQKLRCLAEDPHTEDLEKVLERFDLESVEEALSRHTVIVPVNITYYPIRAQDNVLLRLARGVAGELSPRALEELSVEGTLLSKDTDIDITLGDPIDVRQYLDAPEYAEMMACGIHDLQALDEDPLFTNAARRLMLRYMTDIYENTTVNYDHIFATLVRHQAARPFTERSYRNRIFLCAHRLIEEGRYRVHPALPERYRDILYEEPAPEFQDFVSICEKEGILRREGGQYVRDLRVRQGVSDFHSVRQRELTYVIANEIEPLEDLTDMIKEMARTPRRKLSRVIRDMFVDEDLRIFEEDYGTHCSDGICKPAEIGRPFFLSPRFRARGGVVLVHGYLAAPREVRALAEFLHHKGYYVYGVRLKGHGTTPEDLAQTTWEEWYESVNRGYAVVKSCTDNIIVGGFSTGGGLALLAAGRKGDKVNAAFAINPPLHLRNYAARLAPSLVTMNNLLTRVRRRGKSWEFVDNASENPHINYARNPLTGVRELGRAMAAMEEVLPDICSPTLILQGSRDPVVNPVSAQLIFDKIGSRHKELAILERTRHGIVNGDGCNDVFEHVHRFIEWAADKAGEPEVAVPLDPSVA